MILKINQSLHGYLNGHQLLASSVEINPLDRNNLLFQSDLTGSMVDLGFDSYITGYPLRGSNLYVFAKTWYAPEMERPGCVWTHSLLIDFADIGKIPEFSSLIPLFVRPVNGNFKGYDAIIQFDLTNAIDTHDFDNIDLSGKRIEILKELYNQPNKTIFIPAESSLDFESDVIRTWSDQWPRLRRNFTFCTGALNLKTLGEREYDLQIVPERNINSIKRKSQNSDVINSNLELSDDWISILTQYPKQEVRKFLWAYGADIDGERRNYVSLLKLFQAIYSAKLDLNSLSDVITLYFPSPEEGKFLKRNLFSSKSILPITERELVSYLVDTEHLPALEIDELQLTDRVATLVNNGMSYDELLTLMRLDKSKRIRSSIWDKVTASTEVILQLIQDDESLIEEFIMRSPDFASLKETWSIPFKLQKPILRGLIHSNHEMDWTSIARAMLDAKSKIIVEANNMIHFSFIDASLTWMNEKNSKREFIYDWAIKIFEQENSLKSWIKETNGAISKNIYTLLFKYYSAKGLEKIFPDVKFLIAGYEELYKTEVQANKNSLAITLLSIGLNNNLKNSYLLVERTFPSIYQEVISNRLKDELWKNISKENSWYDSEDFNILDYIPLFARNRKKRFEVEYWDSGRQIIVTTVNNFVRHSWPTQAFVATFINKQEFKDAFNYCLTFEKGTKFLRRMFYEIEQERVKPNPIQRQILSKFINR